MGTYRNPILEGCHPDPSICRVGDEFYLVTSTFEHLPGLPIHRSTDLVHWEPIGHAIHRPGQIDLTGAASSKGLYAPTIRHHDGVFYVVCTVIPGDEVAPARAGHFVVTATDAAGPWSEPVWFDGLEGIDPSFTFDGDRLWLCGTRLAEPGLWDGQCDVWLTELDRDTLAPIGEVSLIWRGALDGAGWAEGPHIHARPGGGWILVAAEGGTDRDHAVCVAYADEMTGPYMGDPGNPRLTHRDLGEHADIANIGHADLVEDLEGRWWAVMLGTVLTPDGNSLCGRQTHLVPVEWERGRPLFAPGIGRVLRTVQAPGVPDRADAPARWRDDFDGRRLDPGWTSPRIHPEEFADLAARPGCVRLTATEDEPTTVGRSAMLLRRLPSDHVSIGSRIEPVPGPGGLRWGLVVRTAESALLEVAVDREGEVVATLVDDGSRTVLGTAHRDAGAPVDIEVAIDGRAATVRVDGAPLATGDLAGLVTGRPGWFVGTWAGPFAVGDGQVDVHHVEHVSAEDGAEDAAA